MVYAVHALLLIATVLIAVTKILKASRISAVAPAPSGSGTETSLASCIRGRVTMSKTALVMIAVQSILLLIGDAVKIVDSDSSSVDDDETTMPRQAAVIGRHPLLTWMYALGVTSSFVSTTLCTMVRFRSAVATAFNLPGFAAERKKKYVNIMNLTRSLCGLLIIFTVAAYALLLIPIYSPSSYQSEGLIAAHHVSVAFIFGIGTWGQLKGYKILLIALVKTDKVVRTLMDRQGSPSVTVKPLTSPEPQKNQDGGINQQIRMTATTKQLQNDSHYVASLVQGFKYRRLALKVVCALFITSVVAGGVSEFNYLDGNWVLTYITQALLLVLGVVSLVDAATLK
jgi:hypothetical protein